MNIILHYLRLHGEQLDSQIAAGLELPLTTVRDQLADLRSKNELITCTRIRFDNGKESGETLYRARGYIPPKARGPKQK